MREGPGLLVVLIAIIVAGIGINVGSPGTSGADAVQDGSQVVGTGYVVERDGQKRFCDLAPIELGGRPTIGCTSVAVPLQGVEVGEVPGWVRTESGGYSAMLKIAGTWSGGALIASEFSPQNPEQRLPSVPCSMPSGGWSARTGDDYEDQLRSLSAAISVDVDLFAGYWMAHPKGSADETVIVTVATTGDVDAVRSDLASIFDAPLCVVRVPYSTSKLENAASELSALGTTTIDTESNRVVVRLPLLTTAIVATLRQFPMAVADPLLVAR